jgi:transposase-like protein
LKDFGDDGVAIVEVEYSKHKCKKCRLHFSVQFPGAAPGSHYTKRVKDTALDLLRQPGIGLKMASEILMKQHFMRIPITTLHEWKYSDYPLAAGGKKDKEE